MINCRKLSRMLLALLLKILPKQTEKKSQGARKKYKNYKLLKIKGEILTLISKNNETKFQDLKPENDIIEERMSLRDRVKAIFKKYGFTVFDVVSAVGLVIGVIVNNLKKGLTSLGKGVGGALKNIGEKIGEILPGMIGAIASFIFKTAGEAVGFLAKNAWLLILAAVMFMIEKFKRNK